MPHSEIPREALTRYNQLIRGVSETANATLRGQMAASPPVTVTDLRKQLSTALRAADSAASEVDRQFYQGARRYVTGSELRSIDRDATHNWDEAYLERVLRNMVYQHGAYDPATGAMQIDNQAAFMDDLDNFVGRMVNDASKSRMYDYGARDPLKPRFARVPSGAETCAWCLAIAGLGFRFKSADTALHSHANCDCVAVPSWGGSGVQGYAPKEYADRYNSARDDWREGNVPKELKERIYRERSEKPDFDEFKTVLAVMRWKYGYT